MRVTFTILAASALALVGTSRSSGADLVRPGLWENISVIEAPNRPGTSPAQKSSHCYTAKDLAGLNARDSGAMGNAFGGPANQKCTVGEAKFSGQHAVWATNCPNGLTIHTDMTFHGDSLEAVLKMDGATSGLMTVHMTSRRVGECK